MSETDRIAGVEPERWIAGVVGGFVGGVLFGLSMDVTMPFAMEETIPAMYGLEPRLGLAWLFHQWHGVVLGVVYVLVVERVDLLRETARSIRGSLGMGVGYGVGASLLPVLVMPFWLAAVGYAGGPPFPNLGFPETGFVVAGHVVYAVPLALAYHYSAEINPRYLEALELRTPSTESNR